MQPVPTRSKTFPVYTKKKKSAKKNKKQGSKNLKINNERSDPQISHNVCMTCGNKIFNLENICTVCKYSNIEKSKILNNKNNETKVEVKNMNYLNRDDVLDSSSDEEDLTAQVKQLSLTPKFKESTSPPDSFRKSLNRKSSPRGSKGVTIVEGMNQLAVFIVNMQDLLNYDISLESELTDLHFPESAYHSSIVVEDGSFIDGEYESIQARSVHIYRARLKGIDIRDDGKKKTNQKLNNNEISRAIRLYIISKMKRAKNWFICEIHGTSFKSILVSLYDPITKESLKDALLRDFPEYFVPHK